MCPITRVLRYLGVLMQFEYNDSLWSIDAAHDTQTHIAVWVSNSHVYFIYTSGLSTSQNRDRPTKG